VTPLYDPMVAKLIVWDTDRERATARMIRALGEYRIEPLTTLIPFHERILASEQWHKGETCRDLVEDKKWLKELTPDVSSAARPGASGSEEGPEEELSERTYKVEVDGRLHAVKVIGAAAPAAGPAQAGGRRPPKRERQGGAAGGGGATEDLASPIQGTVLKVAVEKGAEVEEGALICVIEAMKMENEITAHRSGKLTELDVSEGGSIATGDRIARIE
jgi:acetyl-CoA/propionyl-CoA carboxylase, biotin carboxylase, biotin carboxyl carrier protein